MICSSYGLCFNTPKAFHSKAQGRRHGDGTLGNGSFDLVTPKVLHISIIVAAMCNPFGVIESIEP